MARTFHIRPTHVPTLFTQEHLVLKLFSITLFSGEADTQSSAYLGAVTSSQVTTSVNAYASKNVIRQYHVEGNKDFNKNVSEAFTRFGVHLLRVRKNLTSFT